MSDPIISRFENLITWVSGDQRAPHKPLLVLLALGEWTRGVKAIRFSDAVAPLTELLHRFGPARKSQRPEYPFWRLQRDGVWEVYGVYQIELGADGGATKGSLIAADAMGRFTQDIRNALDARPELVGELATRLLDAHFPGSLHEDILEAVGIELDATRAAGGGRDPNFRKRVLTAYQHQCAVCGLQLLLSGSSVVLEAAHIRWHQARGPAITSNGVCLCVLHHKLFDRGAIGLLPDGVLMVSEELTGLSGLEEHLMRFHAKPIRGPLRLEDRPNPDFIDWHRREVFRGEPRPA